MTSFTRYCQVRLLGVYILIIFSTCSLFTLNDCSLLVPDQFHCVSELHLKSLSPLGPVFSWFQVEEYVDRKSFRSSIKLDDIETDKTKVYFNEVSADKYSFLFYDVNQNTCKSTDHHNWPLSRLKSLVIRLLPISLLTKEYCDVALGPSSLLMAIEESLDDFHYVTTVLDPNRLIDVDVYERIVDSGLKVFNSDKTLMMTVRVASELEQSGTKKEPNLASLVRSNEETDIITVFVCEAKESSLKSRNPKKEYVCINEELVLYVDYYITTKMVTGTLIGQDLEETTEFDFHRDPFLPPVGIGCAVGDNSILPFNGGFSKRFGAPTMKFSAEFVSSAGFRGLSYVAYDGYREVLRLDREGRKSVYDLRHGLSYHVSDEFSVMNAGSGDSGQTKSCISLFGTDATMVRAIMMERLIGVGFASLTAKHLGTKTIEHVAYEVYELELTFDQLQGLAGYNLPILLEAQGFTMPTKNVRSETRFFVTYYLSEYKKEAALSGHDPMKESSYASEQSGTILVPKYIELWSSRTDGIKFDVRDGSFVGTHNLINRLEFLEFNWALDVEPTSDSDSQDLSRLFNIESCAREKSTQLKISLSLNQGPKYSVEAAEKLALLHSQKSQIKEVLHEKLSSALEISRLNMVHLDFNFVRNTGNMFVEARVVELETGLMTYKLLGFVKLNEALAALKTSVIKIYRNRHSLDMCILDSLAANQPNEALYCRGLTVCVLLMKDALKGYHGVEQTADEALETSSNPKVSLCQAHEFKWAPKPVERSESALESAFENKYRLQILVFEYPFLYKHATDKEAQRIKYVAHSRSVELKSLDPFGLTVDSEGASQSPLVGVRYATGDELSSSEAPSSLNANYAVRLTNAQSGDKFRYCEKACQLDMHCDSFSICLRKKRLSAEKDCVLSNLLLTGERVDALSADLRDGTKRDALEVRLDDDQASSEAKQVIKFKADEECAVYPKESLSQFKLSHSLVLVPTNDKKEADEKKAQLSVSLEECAALSYERQGKETRVSNFTYCPMGSLCAFDEQPPANTLDDSELVCFVYSSLSQARFYSSVGGARTRISIAHLSDGADLESAKKNMNELKLGRLIEGLDQEQCARDCNLRLSNCLAFDLCRYPNKATLCLLYSIRSPASPRNLKHGFLPQEVQFYERSAELGRKEGSSVMLTADDCTHFYLDDDFLEIRLQQMLEYRGSSWDEKEREILDRDQSSSDQFFANSTKRAAETSGQLGAADDGPAVRLFIILVGVSIGLAGVLYGKSASVYIMDTYEVYRVRWSQRYEGPRISQVDLTRNMSPSEWNS